MTEFWKNEMEPSEPLTLEKFMRAADWMLNQPYKEMPIAVTSVDEAVMWLSTSRRQLLCLPRILRRLEEMGDEGIAARWAELKAARDG